MAKVDLSPESYACLKSTNIAVAVEYYARMLSPISVENSVYVGSTLPEPIFLHTYSFFIINNKSL